MEAAKDVTKTEFAVCSGGCFNPVHFAHLDILERAREIIEKVFSNAECVAQFCAVTTDKYVINKVGGNAAIRSEHRLEMVRRAAREVRLSRFVDTTKVYGSAGVCMTKELWRQKHVQHVEVRGGDYLKKYVGAAGKKKFPDAKFVKIIIFGRAGYNADLNVKEFEPTASENVFFVLRPAVLFVDTSFDVSSTQIRKALHDPEMLLQMVKDGKLHQSTIDYLQNQPDLFMTK